MANKTTSNNLGNRNSQASRKFAFQSNQRLLRSVEFKRVSQTGRKINSKHFLIFFSPTPNHSRVGITITKKIDPRAARRNRLRRRIRELFRKMRVSFLQQVDLVIIARNGAEALETSSINSELTSALVKSGILPKQKPC